MVTDSALRQATAPKLREDAAPIFALAGVLAAYASLRYAIHTTAGYSAQASLMLEAFMVAAAVAMSSIRYTEVVAPLRILMRGIAIVVLVQMTFDGASLFYTPRSLTSGSIGTFFWLNAVIGLSAGAIAIWRPSFTLPLLISYIAFRRQFNAHAGIDIPGTDYLGVLDIGLFAATGACVLALATRSLQGPFAALSGGTEAFRASAGRLVWACAVGAHFGNYLMSGWSALRAGDGALLWLPQPPIQTSILVGLERGSNPLAAWPGLVQAGWDGISAAGTMLTVFVLAALIAAPLAVLHRRTIGLFAVLFSLFHLAAYLMLGASFLFWIALNLLIYLSARERRREHKRVIYTSAMKLAAVVAVVAGHFLFHTSPLWGLESPNRTSSSLVAETRGGTFAPVPDAYLGLWSQVMAQNALYIPEDHFQIHTGSSVDGDTGAGAPDALTCSPQAGDRQESGITQAEVDAWVRGVDDAMRRRPWIKNANLYYFYPHHVTPNPLVFRDFNRLRIEDIVRYHYLVDSACLSLNKGRLIRDVRLRTSHTIDVRP